MKIIVIAAIAAISINSLSAQNWSEASDNHTTGSLGLGTSTPDFKLDIVDSKESGVLARYLTNVGVNNSGNKTWTFKIGREFDYPNRTIEFGMISGSFGSWPSFYVQTPNDYGRVATLLTKGGVDDSNEYNWTITLGREFDFPNRTLDFGMVSNSYGQNPAFYVAPKGVEVFRITETGNVGIGITNPTQKLQVAGTVYSTEVKVELAAGQGPDYVFEPDYELRTLKETKEYISENKHLPEIPSAKEMEANGVQLGDMNMKLLKKIEELTLYQIELLERLEKAEQEISQLKEYNRH